MNREIKFRAYCPKYDQWVYGATFAPIDITLFYTADDDEVSVIPESVGQYIGLKDRNEKEIYEGDLVEVKTGYNGSPHLHENTLRLTVTYDCNFGCWRLQNDLNSCVLNLWDAEIYSIEIIGNKFDNPDLI